MCMQGLYSNNENEQRVIAAAGLGLAVLAGLCRVSQLAAAPEVIEKIPLFLKVHTQLHNVVLPCQSKVACAISLCCSASDLHQTSDHLKRSICMNTCTMENRSIFALCTKQTPFCYTSRVVGTCVACSKCIASSCNVSRNPARLNGLGGTCGWQVGLHAMFSLSHSLLKPPTFIEKTQKHRLRICAHSMLSCHQTALTWPTSDS